VDFRAELKKPLGELLKGNEEETIPLLKQKIEEEKPKMVLAVGDRVSMTLASLGLKVKLYIYDEKIKRTLVRKPELPVKKTLYVQNPAGTITDESIEAIKKGLKFRGPVAVCVDGEEDLLTLPAILYAPKNSVVVYGQPNEGVVLVKVTDEKKKFVEDIIRKMDVVE